MNTLVQITLDNGQTATVDLGPGASVERIGLDEGDSITVHGHRDQIDGCDVTVAELLKIDGERVASVSQPTRQK